MKGKDMNEHNPYVARTFLRIDFVIYWLRGKKPYWSKNGYLCVGNGEVKSNIPNRLHAIACDLQNHHLWMRKFLSI